jgi:hypothetical protein
VLRQASDRQFPAVTWELVENWIHRATLRSPCWPVRDVPKYFHKQHIISTTENVGGVPFPRSVDAMLLNSGREIFQERGADVSHPENRERDSRSFRETGCLGMAAESSYGECNNGEVREVRA